jgi:hypothetical protein
VVLVIIFLPKGLLSLSEYYLNKGGRSEGS